LREGLNGADAIVCVTRFVADMHIANGIEASRITVVPLSVSLQGSTAPRTESAEMHFGYLGQVVPVKGVDILVRAFRQLSRVRRNARLTIYGSLEVQPDYARRLKRMAGGDPDIHFVGGYRHEDLAKILSGLDVVVVPSVWHENSPIVILEAFAAGRPVIGTDVGGIAEIVQEAVNGLLFGRGSVTDLARQLQRLLDEPELLARLQRNIPPARTTDEEMEQLFGVYRRALNAPKFTT
jgi:glycosyltransferase involved in cell wall biosynthesis